MIRIMPRTAFSLLVAVGLILLGGGPLQGQTPTIFQELGVFYTSTTSDHVELPDPVGFGLYSRWQLGRAWLVRLSYHRSKEETRKPGVVCDQYSQRINCRTETTVTEVTFAGLRGTLSRAIRIGGIAELGLGGGLSFNQLKPKARDLTGWYADLLDPNTGQLGYLANASLTLAPFRRLPLLLVGGYTGHFVNFNGCSGEDPPQYDPFCGWATLKEIEVGMSVVF